MDSNSNSNSNSNPDSNSNSVFARYINLDRRPDRNANTVKKLVDILGFNSSNVKRFSAIDGSNIVEDLRNKNYMENNFIKILQSLKLKVKYGELGCLLSHYFVLEEIYNDDTICVNSFVFIFEDDFFINDTYLEKNNLFNILSKLHCSKLDDENLWDIIYFGGRFKKNFIPSNMNFFAHSFDNFYSRIKGWGGDWERTTHNYLLKKKNIGKILNSIKQYYLYESSPTIQVDKMYSSLSKKIYTFDHFPHLFYSPMNYSTDIQCKTSTIDTEKLE